MRVRVVRKIAGVVGAGVVACGLVACGGSDTGQPKAGAATSVSTSPAGSGASASAGAASSPASDGGGTFELPAENRNLKPPVFEDYPGITENTEQGAEQATKFFFDAVFYGYATGDTGPLGKIAMMDSCEACKFIEGKISSGERFTVGAEGYKSVSIRSGGNLPRENYSETYYQFNVPKGFESEPKPSKIEYEAGANLVYDGSGWKVEQVAWQPK